MAAGGLTVLLGHVASPPDLAAGQPPPFNISFNTGLGFTLTGLSLLLFAAGVLQGLAWVIAGLLAALALLSLGEVILGVPGGVGQFFWAYPDEVQGLLPGRVAPLAALAFLLLAVALLVGGRNRRPPALLVAILSGVAVVLTGTLDLLARVLDLGPTSRLPSPPQMPPVSALLLILAGTGILELVGWRAPGRLPRLRAALGAGTLMVLIGTVLSHLARGQERNQAQQTSAARADGLAAGVNNAVLGVFRTLSTSAVVGSLSPGEEAWRSVTRQALIGTGGTMAMEFLPVADSAPRWQEGNPALLAVLDTLFPLPQPTSARLRSRPDSAGRWPTPLLFEVPVARQGSAVGVLRLAWDAHLALDPLVIGLGLQGHGIEVRYGQGVLYRSGPARLIRDDGWLEVRVLTQGTRPLSVRFWPTPMALAGMRTGLPVLTMTMSCALAILISLGLYFLLVARRRTLELEAAHAALESSQARLREAERLEAVGQLAGGVAHEFNNLLTAVRGYAEAAREALPRESPASADLHEVLAAADRAAILTARLLAVGQRQWMLPQRVAVGPLVEAAVHRLRESGVATIRQEEGVEGSRAMIQVDPARCEEMIVQLVQNVAEATGATGEVVVGTGVHAGALEDDGIRPPRPAGTYYWIEVRDPAAGVDAPTLRRLLEPFAAVDTGAGKLGGLGLAAAFGMVAQSGGALAIQSAPSQGTAVRVYFPEAPPPAAEPASAGEARAAASPGGVILLVEDEEAIRNLAVRALSAAGYLVQAAANAMEGLRLLDALPAPPSLLVTDVLMPGLQGDELAARARDRIPDLPVLFMSGYPADQLASQPLGLAGSAFLHKPFSVGELIAEVAKLVGAPPSPFPGRVP